VSGVAGCTPQSALPTVPARPAAAERPREEVAARRPANKAGVCVAAGNFCESEGGKAPAGSAKQEQLYDQARRAYQQALESDPNHLPAYQSLARLYTAMGDHEHAVATYRKGLQKHPRQAGLWFDLGMCHARHKEWLPAVEALRKAVELDPENRQYVNVLGHCLARAGRYEESLAFFRKTVGEARAHYNVARMLHHLNDNAQARQHLELALRADPKLAPAQQLLAQLDGRAADGVEPAGHTESADDVAAALPQ
jgi:tetratricopeptide (TPR) repeat protein